MINTIQGELTNFKQDIQITDSWSFNQRDTIEQAILYYNSKYRDGDLDEEGNKVYFYNIVRAVCGTTTKAIDIDTKDIILTNAPGGDPLKVWLYQRDLKYWLKNKEFGKLLNRISRDLPQFGSIVLKKVGNEVHFVDLRNFICEQNAETLDLSNYIIEQHLYTPNEFKKIAKVSGWNNIDEVLKAYKGSKAQYIRVFERYGEVEDEDGVSDYKMILIADLPSDVKRNTDYKYQMGSEGIELARASRERHPYFEIHINKVSGRWLGVGIPEMLSDNQIRINEVVNNEVRSSYWNSLRLWQTRDTGVVRNLFSDARDGEVLIVNDEVKQVPMVDSNLTHSETEIQRWEANSKEQSFTYDILRGERTPAGTPLGSAQLSAAQAISFFDQIREDIAMEIKALLRVFIIPTFKKTAKGEHLLRIAGEDIDKINQLITNTNVFNKAIEFIRKNNRVPSQEFIELTKLVEKEKNRKEVSLKIPDGWYENIDYDIDIVISGESQAVAAKANALIYAFQVVTSDPTALTDPVKRKMLSEYLGLSGISLADLEAEVPQIRQDMPEEVGARGGGVSAPMATPTGEVTL